MIGTQLVSLLLDRGADVRVVSMDSDVGVASKIEFMQGNLMDAQVCKRAVAGMDFVFHLAGIKGSVGIGRSRAASFFVPHILMNTLLMEAARRAGVERYLYTSSIAVYHPAPRLEEDQAWAGPPHHTDRFAAWAKRMGELQAEAYREEFGWSQIAIVRPANVFGPRDNFDRRSAMVVPALIAAVARGEDPLVVWGDGSAIRDFIFSRDCALGMLLALERAADGTPINLGSGRPTSIRELVDAIVACSSRPPVVQWDLSKPVGDAARLMDVSRAKERLGFEARTPLQQGIRETYDWYVANQKRADRRYSVFAADDYMAGV